METCNGFEMRCGEVFITRQKLFNFHCSMCHNKYEDFSALLDHVSAMHFTNIVWSSDEMEHKNVLLFHEDKVEWDQQSEEQNVDIKSEIDEVSDVFESECSQDEKEKFINSQQKEQTTAQDNESKDHTTEIQPKIKKRKRLPPKYQNCTICKGNFSNLKAHMSQKHTEERNFKCDQCNWAFKTKYKLRDHQRRHEGLRNYTCAFCEKKFFTSYELKHHERIHTGEKPYVCSQCGKAFTASGLLSAHMKRHNNDRPYKCEHCEKSFYSAQYWKNHIVVHTGERNHICTVCNAAFPRRKSLMQHIKIHINARDSKCDMCDAAFNQKQSLIAHMKSRHNVLSLGGKSVLPEISGIK